MFFFYLFWNSENEYPAGLLLLPMIKYLPAAKAKLKTCQKQRVLFTGILHATPGRIVMFLLNRKKRIPCQQSGLTGKGCNSGEIEEKRSVVFTGIEGNGKYFIFLIPRQEHFKVSNKHKLFSNPHAILCESCF